MIRAAIFDFGGVMTTSPRDGLHLYEAKLGLARGALERLVVGDGGEGAWQRVERGELGLREFWDALCERARSELAVELSLEAAATIFGKSFGARPAMVTLVRELRQDLTTVLLTNNVTELDALWRAIIPVDELFLEVIDSSAVGMRKPDPRIFELALAAGDAEPHEAFFVDDTRGHVTAAAALGIHAIHFADEDDVIARIRALIAHEGVTPRANRDPGDRDSAALQPRRA
jgi:epoxide hydrolase-like predicted phosphatase